MPLAGWTRGHPTTCSRGCNCSSRPKNLHSNSIPSYTPDTYRQINDAGTPYLLDTLHAGRTSLFRAGAVSLGPYRDVLTPRDPTAATAGRTGRY